MNGHSAEQNMKIYIDEAVARHQRPRVEKIVNEALGGRPGAGAMSVSIGQYGHNRWSVFVTGSLEHPLALVETIRTALEREPM
jgi:hypothetical protein